ncbi:MAG: CPBP family intramembrane glutamic endopeptidase [Planctomycetota bacterium]|jgi:membrane protease YdiL (CAAX protease family)
MKDETPKSPTPAAEVEIRGEETAGRKKLPFGKAALAVYPTAAFCLIGLNFLTDPDIWPGAARSLTSLFFDQTWLGRLGFWALASVFFYTVPPTIVALAVMRKGPLSMGLGWGKLHRHLWVYGLLLAGVLPFVILSSFRSDFLFTYPFSRNIGLQVRFFIAWEVLYVLQFLGLEYFFRGFLLFPLEEELGKNAVLVMIVPYAMIHFQKPFIEANGAVFAGLILGWMALKTRSIWGGVLLHGTVAVTMDSLALWRQGLWPPGS